MDFSFSEEQEMLKKSARDFLDENCKKTLVKEMEKDERGYSPELWQKMAELGWLGLVFPEQFGGSNMSFLDLAALLEETGRACLPGPFFSSIVLGGLTLLDAGNEMQKQAYLPGIASGKSFLTLAITESDGRYDATSVKLKAEKSGGSYILNGSKLFVPDAHIANRIICVARTKQVGAAEKGISLFIVDRDTPGISFFPLKTIAGDKQYEVVFQDVPVPADCLLGPLNQGWPLVRQAIERAAVAKSCEMVGIMQRALEMTVAYAKDRKQFGHPIGSLQAIQHHCANMACDVDGSRFSTYQAAWKISEGLEASMEVAVAKAWINEAFGRVITLAHQVHGAIGCTIDHELQYYTKRGKQGELSYGDGDYYREIVAQGMGL
jgi:3-oxocholest-4-en-26-oyl-CoA dehydrogenase beta subunit